MPPSDQVFTVELQLVIVCSPYLVTHPLSPPQISGLSLNVAKRDDRVHAVKVRPSESP